MLLQIPAHRHLFHKKEYTTPLEAGRAASAEASDGSGCGAKENPFAFTNGWVIIRNSFTFIIDPKNSGNKVELRCNMTIVAGSAETEDVRGACTPRLLVWSKYQ
jgi:hypothetical protein